MSYCLVIVLISLCSVSFCFNKNENILIVSPSLSRSNQVWNNALAFGLVRKHYHVTMITPFVPSIINHNKNITYFILEGAIEKFQPKPNKTYLYAYEPIQDINEIKQVVKNNWDKAQKICDYYLSTNGLKQFLIEVTSNINFEVILWDLENSDCLYPLIPNLGNPPVIALSPNGFQPILNWIFGTHWKPYIPFPGLPYDKEMNLMRRFMNAITLKFMHYQKYHVYLKENLKSSSKIFKNFTIDDAIQLELNFSLALINSNFDVDYARDVMPNFILVGGLHINSISNVQTNIKQNKIEKESSSRPCVYISIQENKFNSKQLQGIADCLGSLAEYQIYWRISDVFVVGKLLKPKNIVFNETFNQIMLLANKTTKLFITSGNLLSLQEALYFGVPLLAIPTTYAQENRVKMLPIANGALVAVKEKYLCQKIHGILNDDDYLENTKRSSDRFKDKPMDPLDKAIYWVEYVMRHKSGKQLEPLTRRMSYFEAENIDLLCLVVSLISFIPLGVLCLIIVCVKRRKGLVNIKNVTIIKVKQD